MDIVETEQARAPRIWHSVWFQILVAIVALFLYGGSFVLFFESIDASITAFAGLPVMIFAWFWGIKAGVVSGCLMFLFNTLLFKIVANTGWDGVISHEGIPGAVSVVLIGLAFGFMRDLRERYRRELLSRSEAEYALRASEQNFRNMFERASEGLYIIDMSTGRFIGVNQAMFEMFGYAQKELMTLSPHDLCPKEEKEKQKKIFDKVNKGETVHNFKGYRVRKDGYTFYALCSAHPIQWYGKTALFGSVRDISVLVEYQRQLELKNKEILDFTHVVTHDMRNPLTSLMTIFEFLQMEEFRTNQAKREEMFRMGRDSLQYLYELVENLLQCTRLEEGTHQINLVATNAKELVAGVVDKMKVQIDKSGVTVVQKVNAEITVDRKVLSHVFVNLVENAINYMGINNNPCIEIGSTIREEVVEFYVKDNGTGIAEDDLGKIFKKFKRGSNTVGIKGSGLGLSLVKAIIEAHGGEIWVQSKEGEGTIFFFTVPKEV